MGDGMNLSKTQMLLIEMREAAYKVLKCEDVLSASAASAFRMRALHAAAEYESIDAGLRISGLLQSSFWVAFADALSLSRSERNGFAAFPVLGCLLPFVANDERTISAEIAYSGGRTVVPRDVYA